MNEPRSRIRADDAPVAIVAGDSDRPARAQRFLALVERVAAQLLAAEEDAGLVDGLFRLIATELKLDVFFDYRLANGRLELASSGGLTEAEAAAGAVLAIGQAVCGCVARDRKPIHATAIQASEEPLVAFVRDLGLDAYACTPLLQGGTLLGTLGFGRRWADRFAVDELHFLHTVCHYVALARHRLRVEEDLREAVAARDLLLQELNHRVRNSLQLVVGILSIEERDAIGADARMALAHARDRILIVAAAHQRLYDDPGLTGLDAVGLLRDLAGDVAHMAGVPITLRADRPIILPVERAVSLALTVDHILRRHLLGVDARRTDAIAIDVVAGTEGGSLARIRFADPAMAGRIDPAADRVLAALLRQLRATLAPATGAAPALDLLLPVGTAQG